MPDAAKPPRFFVAGPPAAAQTPFREGQELPLPPTEAHHAAHVLRLKPGAAVELFDGRGRSALGRVLHVRRTDVAVRIEEVRPAAARPAPAIHLAFAVPKGNRLDWLLEKATELGVASLRPVRFERSVAGTEALSPAKRQRWLVHCIAAAKQADLDWLPQIEDPLPLAAFLAARPQGLFGDLSPDAQPLADALRQLADARDLAIVVGPEGGFTDAERQRLLRAGLLPARLGRTTLRIETAAVALVAAAIALAEEP
jgi:16S rRNA (uracil1498-N3)-methyltransferase